MLEWLKANFDLNEIMSFTYNVNSGLLLVQGTDQFGRMSTASKTLSRLDAARLFRLYVPSLSGMPDSV